MIKSKIYVMKIIIYMTFISLVYTLKTVIKISTYFDVNKHLLEVNNCLQILRNTNLR